MPTLPTPDVVYEVDSQDSIVAVNEAWSLFASENAGSSLVPPGIFGRSLWDFIAGSTTIHIYKRLFARVRTGKEAAGFTFRCDSPGIRRVLEMHVAMRAAGAGNLTRNVRGLLRVDDALAR